MASSLVKNLLGPTDDGYTCSEDEEDLVIRIAMDELVKEETRPRRGGSVVGRRVVKRNHRLGQQRLEADYFSFSPVYNDDIFRRRFRMTRRLFHHIAKVVELNDSWFKQKRNGAKVLGSSPLQKVTAALRMLTYGGPADALDEYVRLGESTIIKSLKHFVHVIVHVFGPIFLRAPNPNEIENLLAIGHERGFLGMLGSIDCMHWRWEKCPTAWHGMYTGHEHKPTLILEAVASKDLRIWHAFFGLPGSHNDVNVLHRSPVFDDLAAGNAPHVNFKVNGNDYDMGYYLADGIYPNWATLVKSCPLALGAKRVHFSQEQEGCRKDVERAFGVLQSRWAVMHGPARLWNPSDLNYIVYAVIIMHNMIIEDERQIPELRNEDYEGSTIPSYNTNKDVPPIEDLIAKHKKIRSSIGNQKLQDDLVEHVWTKLGNNTR